MRDSTIREDISNLIEEIEDEQSKLYDEYDFGETLPPSYFYISRIKERLEQILEKENPGDVMNKKSPPSTPMDFKVGNYTGVSADVVWRFCRQATKALKDGAERCIRFHLKLNEDGETFDCIVEHTVEEEKEKDD